MRAAITEIPDGVYTFNDFMDADGINTYDIPICLTLTVKGDRIYLDFDGTSQQVKGNINTTMNAVQASVNYALIAALDSEMPSNQGVLDVVDINCAPGTLLNCVFPAPVAARAHACQRVIDVVLGALSKALPENVIAAANGGEYDSRFLGVLIPEQTNHICTLKRLVGVWGHVPPKTVKTVFRLELPTPQTCLLNLLNRNTH